jgi:anti-sigma factor NepR-like protein
MNLAAVKCSFAESLVPVSSVDSQIRAFLAGDSDGEEVLHAIYDHVLDEPVPERLKALLKP